MVQLCILKDLLKQKNVSILNAALDVTRAGDVRLELAIQNNNFDQVLSAIFAANFPGKLILSVREEENWLGFNNQNWKTFSVAVTCREEHSHKALEIFFFEVNKRLRCSWEKTTL